MVSKQNLRKLRLRSSLSDAIEEKKRLEMLITIVEERPFYGQNKEQKHQ